MQYFEIFEETDSKIIGKHPQVNDLRIDFHKAKASQWGTIRSWLSNKDIPNLKNFKLNNRSKLTDLLSNNFVRSTSGLIISLRCKEIFDTFKVNGSFHPAIVYNDKIANPYSFLWYEYSGKSLINWKKSTFIEIIE